MNIETMFDDVIEMLQGFQKQTDTKTGITEIKCYLPKDEEEESDLLIADLFNQMMRFHAGEIEEDAITWFLDRVGSSLALKHLCRIGVIQKVAEGK